MRQAVAAAAPVQPAQPRQRVQHLQARVGIVARQHLGGSGQPGAALVHIRVQVVRQVEVWVVGEAGLSEEAAEGVADGRGLRGGLKGVWVLLEGVRAVLLGEGVMGMGTLGF